MQKLAFFIVLILVTVAVAVPFITRQMEGERIILRARMAEAGGWSPESLKAQTGVPLHLRLTSDDVVHSFAIGGMDWPEVEVLPGEVTETTLLFEQPGKYTFYCTRWCGANHWRMRGVIEVSGPQGSQLPNEAVDQPPYVELNLDLDAPHPAAALPEAKPDPRKGEAFLPNAPAKYQNQEYLRTNSLADIYLALKDEPGLSHLEDGDLWNLTAALWEAGMTPEAVVQGKELYSQNCAACHGETGAGDGVMAEALAGQSMGEHNDTIDGHEIVQPADFTDAEAMFGANPAVLHGKIIRGGMGTGMPYWGPIFKDEQVWALVAYLQSFVMENSPRPELLTE